MDLWMKTWKQKNENRKKKIFLSTYLGCMKIVWKLYKKLEKQMNEIVFTKIN